MPPSMCCRQYTAITTGYSLSLHPIYDTISTLYLPITYTSAIGGKCARAVAFEDFISSRVYELALIYVYLCVVGFLLSPKLEPVHVFA